MRQSFSERQADTYPASLLQGDRYHREGETAKRKQNKDREKGGERAEIAELIVKVSIRKPSQDSHSATS